MNMVRFESNRKMSNALVLDERECMYKVLLRTSYGVYNSHGFFSLLPLFAYFVVVDMLLNHALASISVVVLLDLNTSWMFVILFLNST